MSRYLRFNKTICKQDDILQINREVFEKNGIYKVVRESKYVYIVEMPINSFYYGLEFGIEKKLENKDYTVIEF